MLSRRMAGDSLKVAWGDSIDGEGVPPFWPWVQILRSLDCAEAGPALAALDDARDEAARFRAFDLVARAVEAAQPVAIVLDDLHWADGASLRLLEFVAPRTRRAAVLVVVATRAAKRPELDATLGMLLRSGAERLELRPLTAAEVAQQLASQGGAESDALAALADVGWEPTARAGTGSARGAGRQPRDGSAIAHGGAAGGSATVDPRHAAAGVHLRCVRWKGDVATRAGCCRSGKARRSTNSCQRG